MNREIKFRAWDEDNNEMIYPKYDGCFQVNSGTRFAIGGNGQLMSVYIESPVISKPKLMQYTGLKDSNGTEIYEGDILQHSRTDAVGEVTWYGLEFGIVWYAGTDRAEYNSLTVEELGRHYTVVGNVFENPELLDQ